MIGIEEEEEEVVVVETVEEAPLTQETPLTDEDWLLGDIDAALAAVESFNEIMPEGEAIEEARADAREAQPRFVPEMKLPPLATLKRGSLGSIIPALLLIGIGAWLTLTTTSGTPPDPLLLAAVIVGGIVLTLLAQWLGSGRWSRGVLFFALLVVLVTGVLVFSVQPNGVELGRSYPLLLVALGLATVLAGFLARPVSARLLVPGALLVLGGVVGLIITLGLLPENVMALAPPLAPVMLVIVLVLLLLPLIFRRRPRRY